MQEPATWWMKCNLSNNSLTLSKFIYQFMKTVRLFSFVILLAALTVPNYSCETETLVGTFTATIGSESWSAIAPAAVKTGSRFTITGLSTNKQIIININGITAGNYTTDVFSGNIQPFVYTPDVQTPQATYVGSSGTITVSSVTDNRISGSFNIIATNSVPENITITGNFTNVLYSF